MHPITVVTLAVWWVSPALIVAVLAVCYAVAHRPR